MSPTIRVAVLGAAGETGSSIVNGLVEHGNFSIAALLRPQSISKPANQALKSRGIDIIPTDLSGPKEDLVRALKGTDVVISAISAMELQSQMPLADAALEAGVKRFVPCAFMPIVPAGGVMMLRDAKEEVYNHIKVIKVPYTIIDVGWWYQLTIPRVPSGKTDYFSGSQDLFNILVGDGETHGALTDLLDIGRYVAAIIADDRTLNKYVFAHNEIFTPNQVYEMVQRLSGETLTREYIPAETLYKQLNELNKALEKDPTDLVAMVDKVGVQYKISWGARADNTPQNAKYLGYLDAKELYPEFKFRSLEDYTVGLLEGKSKPVYSDNKDMQAVMKARLARSG